MFLPRCYWMNCLTLLIGMASVMRLGAADADTGTDSAVRVVGSGKILFVDDEFIERIEGAGLKLHPPRKTGQRLIESEHPWESATLNWFSVLQDGEKYRMWYECYDIDGWPTPDDTSFCYAESTDGIHWTKPKLGLFSYQGSKTFQTPPIEFTGDRLVVNAVARPGGRVRVGLLDAQGIPIPGRNANDCQALTEDNISWTVSWADGPDVASWSLTPIRLRMELHDADVFGFQFSSGLKSLCHN